MRRPRCSPPAQCDTLRAARGDGRASEAGEREPFGTCGRGPGGFWPSRARQPGGPAQMEDATLMQSAVLERFLRYVRYDTQSREGAETYPSTPGQLVLLRDLLSELQALGLSDATIDTHG